MLLLDLSHSHSIISTSNIDLGFVLYISLAAYHLTALHVIAFHVTTFRTCFKPLNTVIAILLILCVYVCNL